MFLHRFHCCLHIAPFQGVEDHGMVLVGTFAQGRLMLERRTDVHHRGVLEIADDGRQTWRRCRLVHGHMEDTISIDPLCGVGLVEHAIVKLAQTLDQRTAHLFDGLPHCKRLEHQPQLVDVMEVVVTELGDDRPSVRVELDQPLGRQVSESLAYRGGAHIQRCRQFRLHQSAAAGQLTIEDRSPQDGSHIFVCRLPDDGGTFIRQGNSEFGSPIHGGKCYKPMLQIGAVANWDDRWIYHGGSASRRPLKAARVVEPGRLEVVDVPTPTEQSQAVVQVHQVGICGTDTKILSGKIPVAYPRILGHEMIGEVSTAPPDSPHPAGTRVLVDPGVSCGWCHLCRSGRTNLCINGGLLGRDVDGVFTEYIVSPVNRLVAVPETISDKAAGLLQVLGTCVHAVKRVQPVPGQVAAVIGLGVTGQLIAQLLRMRGMRVVDITRSEWKRNLASELGAVAVAEPGQASTVLTEVTGGNGPELVVEAVGTEATLAEAIKLVGTGGEILAYGTITGGGKGLPYYELYHKELTLYNPRAAVIDDYADGVALAASGAMSLEPIVSHELDLDEAARAFELVHDSSSLKVLMKVG